MPIRLTPRPLAGVVLALALFLAACGTETAPTLETAADNSQTQEVETPQQASADEEPGSNDSSAPAEDEVSESEQAAPAPTEHLFPDLETVNVASGSTFNLADELAGGDTPVLLWFYAPH